MKIKNKKRWIGWGILAVVVVSAVIALVALWKTGTGKVSEKFTVAEAQDYINEKFHDLPTETARGAQTVIENSCITVQDVEYGNNKDIQIHCAYTAKDVNYVIDRSDELMTAAYGYYRERINSNKMANATVISLNMKQEIIDMLEKADTVSGNVTFYVYETSKGVFDMYYKEETINTCTGGLLDFKKKIDSINSVEYDGQTIDITNQNTLRSGIKQCMEIRNYDSDRPEVGVLQAKWHEFSDEFYRNFIQDSRWQYLWEGLLTTLKITVLSALIGIFLGFLVAIIRCTHQTTGKIKILDAICGIYLTIIRGTPAMVQLIIIYFVFLMPAHVSEFPAAVLCFGLNSGAYVAEIVRGGIMSVDRGQNEAGRSLGFGFAPTMIHIIIPQAFKAVLPALANEFITLLKESSVAFYIGIADLTQGGLKIRSITYSNFMPLIAVAVIYLAIVMILTQLVGILERRLRKSDH